MSSSTRKSSNSNAVYNAIGYRISAIGMWVSIIVLALLSFFSIFVTYSNEWGYRLQEILNHNYILNEPVMVAVAIFMIVCIVGFIYSLSTMLVRQKMHTRTVLITVCIIAAAFQLWWVLAQHMNGTYYPDSTMATEIAKHIVSGDMSIFNGTVNGIAVSNMKSGTQYLFWYPYQSGIIAFFILIFKAFGKYGYLAVQVINIIANIGTIIMLSIVGFMTTNSDKIKIAIPITVGLCIPSLLYSSFVYGNQIGFFLASAFIAMNAYALNNKMQIKKRIALIALSVIPMSLMMIIKSTFLIITIAIAVVWIIELLLYAGIKNIMCLVTFIIAMVLSNIVGKIPQTCLENYFGYSFGQGMPKTAWIAIGLQNTPVLEGMPGWWNDGGIKRVDKTGNDYNKQSKEAAQDIKVAINNMIHNPKYGAWFFVKKLGTEWLTPDFQSRYFAGINYDSHSDTNVYDRHQFNLMQREYNIYDKEALEMERAIDQADELMPFMDGYQSLIYIGAFVSCLAIVKKNKKDKDNIETVKLLLPCIFIVGAAVYLLWEAKAQYLLPFFMCLIPVAVPGIFSIVDKVIEKSHMIKIRN